MLCAEVDSNGFIVATLETFPQCGQLAITTPAHLERLTFWADLAIVLDPAEPELYQLMTAILMLFITAWGIKQVTRLILNR